jgi:CsoR family transcriptional regulator, copper-sensing transcriptional repressor
VKEHATRHDENLARLARVEGQVRGIRKMIENGTYCIDIVTQIQAAQSALGALGKRVLKKHIDHCVAEAVRSGTRAEADEKTTELMQVLDRYFK